MTCNPFHQPLPQFDKLYIFGAGGSGREVAWLADQSWGRGVSVEFVVDDPKYLVTRPAENRTILFKDMDIRDSARFVIAIGDSALRRQIASLFNFTSLRAASIVHPRTEMSRTIEVGSGAIICAGTILTTNIQVGSHVHINVGCTISHDTTIGNFSTLSPGVHLSGNVRIGEGVFLGTGASVINGSEDKPLVIGDNAIVAAGACVTKPVAAGTMVAGVPAVKKR